MRPFRPRPAPPGWLTDLNNSAHYQRNPAALSVATGSRLSTASSTKRLERPRLDFIVAAVEPFLAHRYHNGVSVHVDPCCHCERVLHLVRLLPAAVGPSSRNPAIRAQVSELALQQLGVHRARPRLPHGVSAARGGIGVGTTGSTSMAGSLAPCFILRGAAAPRQDSLRESAPLATPAEARPRLFRSPCRRLAVQIYADRDDRQHFEVGEPRCLQAEREPWGPLSWCCYAFLRRWRLLRLATSFASVLSPPAAAQVSACAGGLTPRAAKAADGSKCGCSVDDPRSPVQPALGRRIFEFRHG